MNYWIGVASCSHVLRGVAGGFAQEPRQANASKAHSAPSKPLIAQLEFIGDKTHWGAAFRFGQVKIREVDFRCIANAKGCSLLG